MVKRDACTLFSLNVFISMHLWTKRVIVLVFRLAALNIDQVTEAQNKNICPNYTKKTVI